MNQFQEKLNEINAEIRSLMEVQYTKLVKEGQTEKAERLKNAVEIAEYIVNSAMDLRKPTLDHLKHTTPIAH